MQMYTGPRPRGFFIFLFYFFSTGHIPLCVGWGLSMWYICMQCRIVRETMKSTEACGWNGGVWDFSEAVETPLGLE